MFIAILGRQPALGMAELERLYGTESTQWFSDQSACIDASSFSIERLGGTLKAGRVVASLPRSDWHTASSKLVHAYAASWATHKGKITLGISAYGFNISPRDVQKTGIVLKQKLKQSSVSLRLVPNAESALNTAASHHNKLGLSGNKVELLVVHARDGRVIIAESIGAQNITALARRDQGRPKRDAFVGMLPPKLAQMMINLATPALRLSNRLQPDSRNPKATAAQEITSLTREFLDAEGGSRESWLQKDDQKTSLRLLDPFCGTGVILQEAALMDYSVYGTDLSEKMIDYSQANLDWLAISNHLDINATIYQGDAMDTKWQPPIDAVACEAYLGQPFSAPPSPEKLASVQKNCDHIISSFLENIAPQLQPGTPLCVAVPAWRDAKGNFTHLPLIKRLEKLGFSRHSFKNVKDSDLLYYREEQVVARELLVITKH
jgi:tRNA G10  N-methylase Trm11